MVIRVSFAYQLREQIKPERFNVVSASGAIIWRPRPRPPVLLDQLQGVGGDGNAAVAVLFNDWGGRNLFNASFGWTERVATNWNSYKEAELKSGRGPNLYMMTQTFRSSYVIFPIGLVGSVLRVNRGGSSQFQISSLQRHFRMYFLIRNNHREISVLFNVVIIRIQKLVRLTAIWSQYFIQPVSSVIEDILSYYIGPTLGCNWQKINRKVSYLRFTK